MNTLFTDLFRCICWCKWKTWGQQCVPRSTLTCTHCDFSSTQICTEITISNFRFIKCPSNAGRRLPFVASTRCKTCCIQSFPTLSCGSTKPALSLNCFLWPTFMETRGTRRVYLDPGDSKQMTYFFSLTATSDWNRLFLSIWKRIGLLDGQIVKPRSRVYSKSVLFVLVSIPHANWLATGEHIPRRRFFKTLVCL